MENVQLQFQGDFIDRLAEEDVVPQRIVDGYFNATAMCAASQKLIADYLRLSTTKAFLHELSVDMGIPISALVQSVRGGNRHLQGLVPACWDLLANFGMFSKSVPPGCCTHVS